jgi:hypothetical protein
MSWSISATGNPEQARATVKGAHVPDTQPMGEIAREAVKELLAAIPEASNVSVSCYGHHDDRQGNVNIVVGYSPIDPAPPSTQASA